MEPCATRDLREPSETLSGYDLINREVTLTVAEVARKKIQDAAGTGKKAEKWTVVCEEKWTKGKHAGKPILIPVNKTRLGQFVAAMGENWKDWTGKKFVAYCAGQSGGNGEPKKAPNGRLMTAIKAARKDTNGR